jgi:hypothetical protein
MYKYDDQDAFHFVCIIGSVEYRFHPVNFGLDECTSSLAVCPCPH